MVFKIEKYREVLDSIMTLPSDEEKQDKLDEWIMYSPSKPELRLAFTTYFPRKTTLRKYLRSEYGFEYRIEDEELEEYKKIKEGEFLSKPQRRIDIGKVITFMNNIESKLNDEKYEFTEDDIETYNIPLRSYNQRITVRNKISDLIFYLMLTSGRRISEFVSNYQGIKDGGKLLFKLNKKRGEVIAEVNPLIDAEDWDELYRMIIPFIKDEDIATLTTRLNRFVKVIIPDFTTHDLRKTYAELCVKRDRRRLSVFAKKKECLNHDTAEATMRYDAKFIKTRHCDICDVDITTRNYARHLKSKKHLDSSS